MSIGVKPKVGMVFETLEDRILFYKEYASLEAFDIRMSTFTKASDDVKVWKYILCSHEGHKHVGHVSNKASNKGNTTQNGKNKKRRRIFNRTGCGTTTKKVKWGVRFHTKGTF